MLSLKAVPFSAGRAADEAVIIANHEARRIVAFAAGLVFLLLLVRTAWISDDAYITFRTVDNVLHGYGLRWNVVNRVQTYTSPLWTFVMVAASAITGDVFYTSIGLSILFSVAVAIIIGLRLAPTAAAAILAFSALFLSKSYVEYSTAGMEDALTHLLLAIYLATWMSAFRNERARPTRVHVPMLTGLASLLMVSRLDAGLLILPTLAATIWKAGPRHVWPGILVGLLPLVAWELAATIYYGFPLPNTYYARLAAAIPRRQVLYQGVVYLFDALSTDPLTITVIIAAMLAPVVAPRRSLLPAGIALYVGYVAWIGGDFVSGRFLAAPFLCAVVQLLGVAPQEFGAQWAAAMALVWLMGFLPGWPANFSSAEYGRDVPAGASGANHINDERRWSYAQTGLLTAYRGVMMPNHRALYAGYDARRNGERVHTTDAAGFVGYGAGPQVYVLDSWGIGDPLIARLPSDVPPEFGHYGRRIPDGYQETLETGRNVIRDPGVAAFYERLRIITEGPTWSIRRWRTIVAMNLGRYDRFVADYGKVRLQIDDLSASKPNGTRWDQPGIIMMTQRGAEIALRQPTSGGQIEISVSGNDTYTLEFLRADQKVGETKIVQPVTPDGSLLTHTVGAPIRPYDKIVVRPSAGDGRYGLGHVRLIPN